MPPYTAKVAINCEWILGRWVLTCRLFLPWEGIICLSGSMHQFYCHTMGSIYTDLWTTPYILEPYHICPSLLPVVDDLQSSLSVGFDGSPKWDGNLYPNPPSKYMDFQAVNLSEFGPLYTWRKHDIIKMEPPLGWGEGAGWTSSAHQDEQITSWKGNSWARTLRISYCFYQKYLGVFNVQR